MKRLFLGVALSLSCSFAALGQAPAPGAPGARPGVPTPTGAQTPGVPPRDANRPTTPQTGTAKIRGRVAAQTGEPLGRAQLTLLGAVAAVRKSVTTDPDGRYEFAELPPGSFTITASKTGFVNLQYGQRRPFEPGTPVAVSDGQSVERIDFSLPRGSVIVARVTDDLGGPLSMVQVQVQRFQYQPDGRRGLVPAGNLGLGMTDDRGDIRLFGLMPGEYIVSATYLNPLAPGGTAASEGFTTTYYPGVASPTQATAVSVGIGEETSVQLAMLSSRLARIRGTVTDSEGRPAAGSQVIINAQMGVGGINVAGLLLSVGGANGQVGADGAFTITGVPPGDYTLDVRPRPIPLAAAAGARSPETASMPIVVAGTDIDNVRLVTSPGSVISGRIVYDGAGAPPAEGAPNRVIVTQADPSRALNLATTPDPQRNGTLDANGRFEIAGATGRVLFNLSYTAPLTGAPTWTMKSVTHEGRNITDEPFDLAGRSSISDVVITLTNRQTVVTGQVNDVRGQVMRDYVVVVLPAEEKEPVVLSRFTRITRPNTQGQFEFRGLRPGRYVAAAVEALEQGRQFAPEFQQQLRRVGRQFSIDDGGTASLDLRLTPDL